MNHILNFSIVYTAGTFKHGNFMQINMGTLNAKLYIKMIYLHNKASDESDRHYFGRTYKIPSFNIRRICWDCCDKDDNLNCILFCFSFSGETLLSTAFLSIKHATKTFFPRLLLKYIRLSDHVHDMCFALLFTSSLKSWRIPEPDFPSGLFGKVLAFSVPKVQEFYDLESCTGWIDFCYQVWGRNL